MDAIRGFGAPEGTTMPMPVFEIVTLLLSSILPFVTRLDMDAGDEMTRSASSPPMIRLVMAPIVLYWMITLWPDVRSKSPMISLKVVCIEEADKRRIFSG